MTKKLLFSILAIMAFVGTSYGQLKVIQNGNVGIGIANPGSKLEVAGNGVFEGQLVRIGRGLSGGVGLKIELGEGRGDDGPATIDFVADKSAYPDFGVRFARFANGDSQFQHRGAGNFVFNALDGGKYFFQVSGSNKAFIDAGGFKAGGDGVNDLGSSSNRWKDIWATNGAIQTSDASTKNNVRKLEYGLEEIMSLNPVSFYWNEIPDQGRKIGLIAQDVQKVVEEVVYDKHIIYDATGASKVVDSELLGMNYSELVPVLINAIQEQQEQIEELQNLLGATEIRQDQSQDLEVDLIDNPSKAKLGQNQPNPFKGSTRIPYTLPSEFNDARLMVYSSNGIVLQEVELVDAEGVVKINARGIGAGVYTYSLVVDGEIVETKKMVLANR